MVNGVWEVACETIAAAVLSALMLSGCATMIRGTTQQVSINTDPPGATVTTSTGQSCTSPCLFEAERKNTLQVTIERGGCNTYTSAMIPTLAGAGAIWGGLIDYGTGAVYDLQPNPFFVKLTCAEDAIQPAAGPAQSTPSGMSDEPVAISRSRNRVETSEPDE
jgi:hypothetical protein